MHAGMTPHRAWQTQPRMRETDSREERQGSVLTDWGASRERSGAERRGDKDPDPTLPTTVGRARPTGIPISCIAHKTEDIWHNSICIRHTFAASFEITVSPLSRSPLSGLLCGRCISYTSHSGCNADTICPGLCETLHKMTQIWASAR